ncbi:hypothetical protein [Hydrogenophaga sp.]
MTPHPPMNTATQPPAGTRIAGHGSQPMRMPVTTVLRSGNRVAA